MELIQETRATLDTKVNSLSTNAAQFTFYILKKEIRDLQETSWLEQQDMDVWSG